MNEPLLTMEQAAERLSIAAKTLREHVRHGEIAYILVGRGEKRKRRLFAVEDIERFKHSRRMVDQPVTLGEPKCQSTSRRARNTIATISNSGVVAFSEIQKQRAAEKLKKSRS